MNNNIITLKMAASAVSRSVCIYLGAVNLGTAALFAYDKHQATQHSRRVSEKTLCQTATFGGWPAGLVAMQLFRHKTRKKSFQRKYVDAMSTNAMAAIPLGVVLYASPPVRAAFVRDFRRLITGGSRPPSRWGGGRNPPRWRR